MDHCPTSPWVTDLLMRQCLKVLNSPRYKAVALASFGWNINHVGIGFVTAFIARDDVSDAHKYQAIGTLAPVFACEFRKEASTFPGIYDSADNSRLHDTKHVMDTITAAPALKEAFKTFLQARVTAIASPCIVTDNTVDYILANAAPALSVENRTCRRSQRTSPTV